jgi:hypothetical protein
MRIIFFCKSTERADTDALGVNLNTMGSVSIFEARGEALPYPDSFKRHDVDGGPRAASDPYPLRY